MPPRWRFWEAAEGGESNRHLLAFLAVFAVIAVVAIGGVTLAQSTVEPRLCSSCHSGLSVAKGLAMSSHSGFTCVDCHKPSGFRLAVGTSAAQMAAVEVAGHDRVRNEVCLRCHTANRKVSPSGDIQIPHQLHLSRGLSCVTCHVGAVHGARDLRGQGVIKFKGPSMTTCIDCHVEREVTTQCSACHTADRKPASHKVAAWATEHGREAQKDANVCGMCHSFTKDKAVRVSSLSNAFDFATKVDFCTKCHAGRPPTHTDNWAVAHRERARADRSGCLVCHSETRPGAPEPGTAALAPSRMAAGQGVAPPPAAAPAGPAGSTGFKPAVYCQQCHRLLHPENWRQVHPTVVRSAGVQEARCFNCHASNSCQQCHEQRRAPARS